MIETGKRVLGLIFQLGKIIKLLMIIYFEITNDLDEITHIQLLFWQCWINYRSYHDQGILWYKRTWLCEKLLNFVKTLKISIINLKIFVKKHWKNNFEKISIKKIIKITKYKQTFSKTTMDRKKNIERKKYLFLKKYILKKKFILKKIILWRNWNFEKIETLTEIILSGKPLYLLDVECYQSVQNACFIYIVFHTLAIVTVK